MPRSWWSALFRRHDRPASHRSRSRQRPLRAWLIVEALEDRVVPAVHVQTNDILLSPYGSTSPYQNPDIGGATGFTPAQDYLAYGWNQLSFNGTAANGAGTTIAIVDAYGDPTIKTDLVAFDKEFGLPNPIFKVVNQKGGSTLPAPDPGWAGETSLDVEWSHTIAPAANIILVEANSSLPSDMYAAVKYAAHIPGVDVVSMSFGQQYGYASDLGYDTSVFSAGANPGVVFVAASGDDGAPPGYPAISPEVLAVGGTSLFLSSSNNYESESGWEGSGGGFSTLEAQPAYQKGVVTQTSLYRANPDVSYDADPYTGFDVYQTYGNSPTTPWLVYGGTSIACPQWAALVAITDQGLALNGQAPLNNATLMPELYSLPTSGPDSAFHDITTGESLGIPSYKAGPGYDLVTGLGTPIVNVLIPDLITSPPAAEFGVSAPTTVVSGQPFNITVTAENPIGQTIEGYRGTINFVSSDLSAVLPDDYTFTSADDGSHTFSVTLNSTGSQTITVMDILDGATGTATVGVGSGGGTTGGGGSGGGGSGGGSFSVSGYPSIVTAGTTGDDVSVTALTAGGAVNTKYSGTVEISSSDTSVKPFDVTLTNGTAEVPVVLTEAGVQSITATDTSDAAMTGSETGISVTPSVAAQLQFTQEPINNQPGVPLDPVVAVEDQYGNLVTGDNTTQIDIAAVNGASTFNPTGVYTETVVKGVAAFDDLSVDPVANGYTLTATAANTGRALTSATSTSFNIATGSIIDNFTDPTDLKDNYHQVGSGKVTFAVTTAAGHTGTSTQGLSDAGDQNWYYYDNTSQPIGKGDTVTVWVEFPSVANGRAYFGFGSTSKGTDSVVLAPNTNQLIIQSDTGYDTYTTLAATGQKFAANTWYLVQVQWGSTGEVNASLYSSTGTKLLSTVSASVGSLSAGEFAFRATGSTKYFATVDLTSTGGGSALRPNALSSIGGAGTASGPTAFVLSPPDNNATHDAPSTAAMQPPAHDSTVDPAVLEGSQPKPAK